MCLEGTIDLQSDLWLPSDYQVFIKPTEYSMSQRKLEGYKKLAEIRAYYQRNPVKFMEDILGAKLLDSQAYCVANSWNTPFVLWVCSRGWGKSTVVDLMLMAKSYLNPFYTSYIAAGSSEQSIQTFQTLYNSFFSFLSVIISKICTRTYTSAHFLYSSEDICFFCNMFYSVKN